jgi:hypothetical protein
MMYFINLNSFQHGSSDEDEGIFQAVLNVLSVMPLDYHMKNLWNQATTNEELVIKFKNTLSEYLLNQDANYVGQYLKELNCNYFYHEFVKRALVMTMEKVRFILIILLGGRREL